VPFLQRAQEQGDGDVIVSVAVPDADETRSIFGVDLYGQGIQPVWVQVQNLSEEPQVLLKRSTDVDYYPPGEVFYLSRFTTRGQLTEYGILSPLLLPVTLPRALVARWRVASANAEMELDIDAKSFPVNIIVPGSVAAGFVFTSEDPGSKHVDVVLLGPSSTRRFSFLLPVPGARLDHHAREFGDLFAPEEIVSYDDEESLRVALAALPCCTTRQDGSGVGDPLNLVFVGEFDEVLAAFTHAGWDETEALHFGSAWRTFTAFFTGGSYRISPMSSLWVLGRDQDVGFQKIRNSIHQRHHFRLWLLPVLYQGRPVWLGAASRDIGVYFTTKTWNLTTHAIDADVDDARDYVLEDLLEVRRLEALAMAEGVGAAHREEPRRNLMGAPWYTDGFRGFGVIADAPVEQPRILGWRLGMPADRVDEVEPVGSFRAAATTVAAGLGVTRGRGTLRFQGESRGFRVEGLDVVDLGVAQLVATGEVFGLRDVRDFEGTYVAGGASAVLIGGAGGLIAQNEHGVVVRVRARAEGMRLRLGPSGMRVQLE
jgi:hypothetical protein